MGIEYDIDTVVIGGGVVGLSVALACRHEGSATWVLEREARAGEGISSRNSGVIHAGLYYPTDSLKARLCVRGRDLLYAVCVQRGVPHQRCGKLVVAASESEIAALAALARQATANGVAVEWLDAARARAMEPALRCVAALDSPDSGIVDVPEFVMALIGAVEQGDSRVLCGIEVARVERVAAPDDAPCFRIVTAAGDAVHCRRVVNAAGLDCAVVAGRIDGFPAPLIPRIHFAAGHYYALRGRAPFGRLIYPLPGVSGLGIHLGFDSAGRSRFGPDVRWQATPDYRFDDALREQFTGGIRTWFPDLDPDDLTPDFVGVRPKLSGAGEHAADFMVQHEDQHGVPGLVNLFGIDSPGLTASLAIGEYVAKLLHRAA